MKIISIRQPGYLPYIGFFKKIESVDNFVILDDVQYTRSGWDNRNKIKTHEGEMFLTVPVLNNTKKNLNQVEIDYSKDWINKHKSTIKYHYKQAPFFDLYWKEIEKILEKSHKKLLDLNMDLINYFNSILQIKTKTVFSSKLNFKSNGSTKLLEICKALNADTYLSGELGHDYLNIKIFENEKIKIIFEKFEHPKYTQRFSDFRANMSIIDLLFNEGENSIEILRNSKNY